MSSFGMNREDLLTKVDSLASIDLVRVVKSGSSRSITLANLSVALAAIAGSTALRNVTTVTTNYLATAGNDVVLADVSGGALSVTLPDAATSEGKVLAVKKSDGSTNDVTVQSAGGLIDGNVSVTLSGSGGARPALEAVSDGANWYIINA